MMLLLQIDIDCKSWNSFFIFMLNYIHKGCKAYMATLKIKKYLNIIRRLNFLICQNKLELTRCYKNREKDKNYKLVKKIKKISVHHQGGIKFFIERTNQRLKGSILDFSRVQHAPSSSTTVENFPLRYCRHNLSHVYMSVLF